MLYESFTESRKNNSSRNKFATPDNMPNKHRKFMFRSEFLGELMFGVCQIFGRIFDRGAGETNEEI